MTLDTDFRCRVNAIKIVWVWLMQEFQIRVHRYTPKNFFRGERFDTLRASFPQMWHLFSRRKSSSASPIVFSLILFTDSSELRPKITTSPFRNCILVESSNVSDRWAFKGNKRLQRCKLFVKMLIRAEWQVFIRSYYLSPMGCLEEVQNV